MKNSHKIAVLFSGTGTNFEHIVKTLHHQGFEVVVALTNNPSAKGIEVAKSASIPLEIIDSKSYERREDFDTEVVKRLKVYKPDLTILAGFMRILTPIFTTQIKSINLHPSLLPKHKGLHAIEKSYQDEDPYGGVSVHYVTSELDSGEIILQKKIRKENLSYESYCEKINGIEKLALQEAIQKVLHLKD